MGKIIAIGGGEIGRPGTRIETLAIDKEIIKQSGKKHPKLLFIPTASKDAALYVAVAQKYFGKKLGCKVDTLLTIGAKPAPALIKKKILTADIVYVGGGNTLYMLKKWRSIGIDKILRQAYRKGVIMAGVSAGAVCWFKDCLSDSRMMTDPSFRNYVHVSCLNWFNLTLSPHHLREKRRKPALIKLVKKSGDPALALDDYAALEIINNRYRIVTSKKTARAHKVFAATGKVIYRPIIASTAFRPVTELTSKT